MALPKRLTLPDPRKVAGFTDEQRRFFVSFQESVQDLLQMVRDSLMPGRTWSFDDVSLEGDLNVAGGLTVDALSGVVKAAGGLFSGGAQHGDLGGLHQDVTVTASPQFARLNVDNTSTYIDRDGSGNLTLTDAVVGTRTLKQLGCPTYRFIKATGQNPGDLHLSDGATWAVSKALIQCVRVMTASTNWDLYMVQNDNGYEANDANIPRLRIAGGISGNANLMLNVPYQDEDASDEVHLYYVDNSGANAATIIVLGYELL